MAATDDAGADADLMRSVAAGSPEALARLHRRFAPLLLGIAGRTIDRAAAEDLVQDVFLAVWRNADRFDPARGTLRAWILQITHFRLLNELRRRSRQPDVVPDPDGLVLDALPAGELGPADRAAEEDRRAAVRTALASLPASQREAVGLAFLEDLTHSEVASELGVPLGTAKTRIRSGLEKLRGALAPQWAALVALCLLGVVGARYVVQRAELARDDRALSMLTASDSVNLRLAPAPGTAAETHARYRARPGAGIVVLTLSAFPPAPAGHTYHAWVRHGATWTSLGTITPDAAGSARLIVEAPALATLPDGVEVRIEPGSGSAMPGGRVVVGWAR